MRPCSWNNPRNEQEKTSVSLCRCKQLPTTRERRGWCQVTAELRNGKSDVAERVQVHISGHGR